MKEYSKILHNVLTTGINIPAARENMPSTKFKHSQDIRLDFNNGFPILTGKKMPFYSIVAELIGFMKGVTDVREFNKLGTKVWWDNAYKWNIKDRYSTEHRVRLDDYKKGNARTDLFNLGRIYSAQWRNYKGVTKDRYTASIDQLSKLITSIKNTPYSRYHVMTAWNPAEMNIEQVSQPNCHVYFQASCTPCSTDEYDTKAYLNRFLTSESVHWLYEHGYSPNKNLYTHLTQRSCDMFLGVPFNLTSYSLFTILLAIMTNSVPIEFKWTGVNSHIYGNHIDATKEYLIKPMYKLPKLDIKDIQCLFDIEAIDDLQDIKRHFKLEGYTSNDKIKAPLSVGL